MTRTSEAEERGRWLRPEERQLARARERFLSSQVADNLVRGEVQASWTRSIHLHVEARGLDPVFVSGVNQETLLTVTAAPILKHLAAQLANEQVGIILTDAHGLILQQICSDPELSRNLDDAHLVAGFNYGEDSVGTNGIGTALECRAPMMIHGQEHYVEDLGKFSCAGAPIRHLATGVLMGVLDLTCLASQSNSLLLAFARLTADRIEQELLKGMHAPELALVSDYLAACHHTSGAVLALNSDLVMMNNHVQQNFDPSDQAALLARSADAAGARTPMTLLADLPSGLIARMDYRPTYLNDTLAGGVLRIRLNSGPIKTSTSQRGKARPVIPVIPGIVGMSTAWQRTCRVVVAHSREREWIVLEGEAGVGKVALLHGVHQLRSPSASFRVVDAADLEDSDVWLDAVDQALANDVGSLVLRRVHLLTPAVTADLAVVLQDHADNVSRDSPPWVVMTMCGSPRNSDVDGQLLPLFPHTVEVPALRHRIEDINQLVPKLLRRLTREASLTCSPETIRQLMRLPWMGNVEQLRQVLSHVAQQRRSGTIELGDLPPGCKASSRRQLSQMEALERDAIVNALIANAGSKVNAANDLGMSRATIYRKIRDYGIALAQPY